MLNNNICSFAQNYVEKCIFSQGLDFKKFFFFEKNDFFENYFYELRLSLVRLDCYFQKWRDVQNKFLKSFEVETTYMVLKIGFQKA